MTPKIKVLFVASELNPLAKVGGLADVIGALPKALKKLGLDVRVAIPKYRVIDSKKYPSQKVASKIEVKANNKEELIDVYQTKLPQSQIPVYLIHHPEFLGTNGIYFEKDATPSDSFKEIRKFIFLSKSILEIFPKINWWPQIIHCHDWHVGLLPPILKIKSKKNPQYKKIKSVLTIHNLAYQGKCNRKAVLDFLELTEKDYPSLRIGDKDDINFIQQGILTADTINTVSPNYAREILTKKYGGGLEGDLKKRKKDLYGVINGIDLERFNPEVDPEIKTRYSLRTLRKKEVNKLDLQKAVRFKKDKNILILGMVSRLTDQKGIDLVGKIIPSLAKLGVQMVFLGVGQDIYENLLKKAQKKYPRKVSTNIEFNAHLAQQIYAGADLFLMPSRFEPCGLGQMIAMRYGTLPVVRTTGGLQDTVKNYNSKTQEGTGFVFKKYQAKEFLSAIERALKVFQDKKTWLKLIKRTMSQDFSWSKSARQYLKIYLKTLKK